MDNRTTAMTGHQDHPGNNYTLMGEPTREVDIENLVRAIGVEKVISVNAFNVKALGKALKECTAYDGYSRTHHQRPLHICLQKPTAGFYRRCGYVRSLRNLCPGRLSGHH